MLRRILPAVIVMFASACGNDLERVEAVELPEASPDRVTTDAEYLYSDSGIVRNRLRAGRIAEWATEPKHTEMSDGVELLFFDAQGQPGSKLNARRGSIQPGKKRMEVKENVVFVNTKGERLETEELLWEQDSARIHTDKAVRVQRGMDVIHGMGLDAAEDFSQYTIRHVTGVIHLQGDSTKH
ncbi:MAG TPA: LPS export ABC transporter periplasmic protein LptC [Flavobacteriales bacterium]|nr:LPS export ABC transporter periplasmic protein LptC [Flavobacteriales bacterium]